MPEGAPNAGEPAPGENIVLGVGPELAEVVPIDPKKTPLFSLPELFEEPKENVP